MEISDEDLIEQYRAGEIEALDVLIRRYTESLYTYIYRLTLNTDDSIDIVQESFIKIWKSLDHYRLGQSFQSWAFTITRNTTIDWMRKRKAIPFSTFDTEDGNSVTDTLSDQSENIEFLFDKQIQDAQIEKLLEQLSVSEREIISLRYTDQMTFDEIGKILDKPLNTVKSRHRRAIERLKEFMHQNENLLRI